MTNTKERHREILAAAHEAIEAAGGVETIDALPQDQRKKTLTQMGKIVTRKTGCNAEVGWRNVTKALQRARHPFNDLDRWGGSRPNTGLPRLPTDQKRQRVSTRLDPGSKELFQAIAKVKELPGWGRAVDLAGVKMVEGDPELRSSLADMGIIVKKSRDEKC